jgi:hypothetical protein
VSPIAKKSWGEQARGPSVTTETIKGAQLDAVEAKGKRASVHRVRRAFPMCQKAIGAYSGNQT